MAGEEDTQALYLSGPSPNSASSGDRRNRNLGSVAYEVLSIKSRGPGIFRDNLQMSPPSDHPKHCARDVTAAAHAQSSRP